MRVNRERFAAAMARHDLNGEKLALLTGLSRWTITAVKTGKSCNRVTAAKLTAVLGEDILETERSEIL